MAFILNKNLVIIGSMQIINSSFEKWVKNLSDDDFKYLTQEFGSKHSEFLKQKDVYLYEYMKSFKRCSKKLSNKNVFTGLDKHKKDGPTGDNGENLDGHTSNEEYLTCIKIWNEFNMKNMSDYHDHYFRKDVLLFADAFGMFIYMCSNFYKLDPCHYFSFSGLSWNALLKMTGVKLEKISDIDIYLFTDRGLRRGISTLVRDLVKQIKRSKKL